MATSSSFVLTSDRNGITTITIARPERLNAIGPDLARQLRKTLQNVAKSCESKSKRPRALVLCAATVKRQNRSIWIAGGDLKELRAILDKKKAVDDYVRTMESALRLMRELPIPVVLYLDGEAIGGGAELAMGCDLRIWQRNARLEFKQQLVGLPLGYGTAFYLVQLVGLALAQKWLWAEHTVNADEALNWGLAHKLVEDRAAFESFLDQWLQRYGDKAFEAQKFQFRFALSKGSASVATQKERKAFLKAWGNPRHRSSL